MIKISVIQHFEGRLLFVVFFFIVLMGCTKTAEIVPEFEEGYIAGYLKCVDEFGNYVNTENVEIFVDGSPDYRSKANTEGYYKIKSPIGYQHFVFQKEGFGTYHLHDQLIVGGINPVIFNSVQLCIPVDVEVKVDSAGITETGESVFIAGIAKSDTPFDLVMVCYAEEFSEDLIYIWLDTYDEPESSVYSCNYNAEILLLNFPVSSKTVYAAIYCQNAFDYIKDEGGTLKQVTKFIKIELWQ